MDVSNGEVKWSFPGQNLGVAAFSPDGRQIAVTRNPWLSGSSFHKEIIELRSTATGTVIRTLQTEGNSESSAGLTLVAFSAEGKRLAAAPYAIERIDKAGNISHEHFVKIWDVTTGSDLLTLENQNHN